MSTPLFSAVSGYLQKQRARFHMPGHKGVLDWLGNAAVFDVTEADGCDELYRPRSAIAELEARYAHLYKSAVALLCTGGSTLCIQTMLALSAKPGQTIICGRGCHTAAVNAMALLDLTPVWIFPDMDAATGLAKAVTAAQVREALHANPDASAVYLTGPDYFGIMTDITAVSQVCREYAVPLLIDNAHGAYLRFLTPTLHPINLGADMCADSLHKTLPVLTGGAMLHLNGAIDKSSAKRLMSVFGSTSPSYLAMLSADKALGTLESDFTQRVCETAAQVDTLRKKAVSNGFSIPNGGLEPLKLTLGFAAMGYSSAEFAHLIRDSGIEPEMVSERFCVLMASPQNIDADFGRLERFLTELPQKTPLPLKRYKIVRPQMIKTPREAVLSGVVEIPVEQAVGRIAGSVVAPCPPGIPAVIPGELVDENLALHLKRSGISRLNVLE